jgi:hypothetical protein
MIRENLALIVCIVGGILFLVINKPEHSDVKALAKDCF